MFQQYECVIHLGGEIKNQARKIVTAPEMIILSRVHGGFENITNIKLVDPVERDQLTERERLSEKYNPYLGKKGQNRETTSVANLFGEFQPLPTKLPQNIFDDGELSEEDGPARVAQVRPEIAKGIPQVDIIEVEDLQVSA